MSADLVPGCIRRLAFASMMLCSMVGSWVVALPRDGDLGPIWISVGGGGLGSLGELGGRDMLLQLFVSNNPSTNFSSSEALRLRRLMYGNSLYLVESFVLELELCSSRQPPALNFTRVAQGCDLPQAF
jgi:hypothetical protein